MEIGSIWSIVSGVCSLGVVGFSVWATFRTEKPNLDFKIIYSNSNYYIIIKNYSFRKVALEISSQDLNLRKLVFHDELSKNSTIFPIVLIVNEKKKNVKDFKIVELISKKKYSDIKYGY